ncbi:MAG TPA: hypothetical protein VGO58_11835, partial [Chitinophagaceae bacterium]|nr:hypothetical protein [Chitinophagaceae bacterium]
MLKASILVLFFATYVNSRAQDIIPDISHLKTKKEQLQRMAEVCDSFNRIEQYEKTKQLSHYAATLIDTSDHYYQSLFYYYIAACH